MLLNAVFKRQRPGAFIKDQADLDKKRKRAEVPEKAKRQKHRTRMICAIRICAFPLISQNGFRNLERKTALQHSAIFLAVFCQSNALSVWIVQCCLLTFFPDLLLTSMFISIDVRCICSIRCICKVSRAAHVPMLDLYHSCKIFQINQIYEYELGKFMYNIVHNCFPSFISNCYSHINEIHNYPTRIATNNNLTTTSSKKYLTRRSIQYTEPRLWNNIPIDLRNKSFLAFCPAYKKYLLDQVVL